MWVWRRLIGNLGAKIAESLDTKSVMNSLSVPPPRSTPSWWNLRLQFWINLTVPSPECQSLKGKTMRLINFSNWIPLTPCTIKQEDRIWSSGKMLRKWGSSIEKCFKKAYLQKKTQNNILESFAKAEFKPQFQNLGTSMKRDLSVGQKIIKFRILLTEKLLKLSQNRRRNRIKW